MNVTQGSPVRLRVPRELFTDREHELGYLRQWVEWVRRHVGHSLALVGPRRMGKSAILTLLYNEMFWEQEEVVPFYLEIPPAGEVWRDLARRYVKEFVRQYAAFRLKEPALFRPDIDRPTLESYLHTPRLQLVREFLLEEMPRHDATENDYEFWHWAISRPEALSMSESLPIVVMVDEFQFLNDRVYRDEGRSRLAGRLTDTYFSLVESWGAPMLVAGSAVTIMSTDVLADAMNGRFHNISVEPLSLEAGAELALRAAWYNQVETTPEGAELISRLCGGHPFYVTCAFQSRMPGKDLTTPAGVERTYEYEVRQGRIHEFWQSHFKQNVKRLGGLDAKRVLFYLLKWEAETSLEEQEEVGGVDMEQIAADLGLKVGRAEKILERLAQADVIQEEGFFGHYRGLRDGMLARCLRLRYEDQIRDVTKEEVRQEVVSELHARIAELQAELEAERGTRQGKMRNLLGQMGQAFIGYVMLRGFRNQTVRGEFFGVEGNVFLPHFARVFPTFVQAEGSEGHQIDNHGLPRERRHPHWVTEQKSWEEPVGVAEVDTFLRAVEEFREVKGVEEVVGWMYAKSGFTDPARALLRERGVLHSDLEQVCGLMEAAGLV